MLQISDTVINKLKNKANGKLILITSINPTPLGEGKTTIAIGLADGLKKIGKKTVLALREPSLGPVFGIKGGATGGGYAQVAPMEEINLHFTGDIHAITSANNLLAALIDNHIYFGNELGFDRVIWKRCVDLNDRQLRKVNTGLSGEKNIVPREDGFDISVASEIMAIFCLAENLDDLKRRNYSFPSIQVAFAVSVALTVLRYGPNMGLLLSTLAIALTISRFLSGVHYLSDVIVSICIAFAINMIFI